MSVLACPAKPLINCVYLNNTSRIQIVRIENLVDTYFERTVFPGQQLIIETTIEAVLDIYSGPMMSTLLEQRIPCQQLPRLLGQPAPPEIRQQHCPLAA